ncbi:hypothetical protein KI614_05810 [Dechloromonas denitrificans]|uniref:hypothetical protein n=1 Tax=Dechloromonas denitrificans TaxID=281362 RepID=UPI001CF827DE|nr:hypothetical protein [Dechloromonas denitrificans]UCV12728.1 hypothetical protein KI614_05810 [Dechloromonas denitrificans]
MDISNINSSTVSSLRNSDSAAGRIEREGRSREQDAPVRAPENKAGQLLKALEKTLDQSGLAPAASSRPPVATETQANDAESASSSTAQNAGQALPEFMNALFQALNATGNSAQRAESNEATEDGGTVSASRRTDAYSDLAGRLQNLAQSLGTPADSGSGTTGSSKTGDLETSFRNLALALQGKTSPETSPQSAPDLQSFLKTLAHNLNSTGSRLDSAGNLVNTQA